MNSVPPQTTAVVPFERIERAILVVRGQKVILDETLAELYGVPTKRLNEQVKRNRDRFPGDFMFQLSLDERESLRSQIATLKRGFSRTQIYPNGKGYLNSNRVRFPWSQRTGPRLDRGGLGQ